MTNASIPVTVIDGTRQDSADGETKSRSRGSSWLFTVLKVGISALAISVVAFTVDLSDVGHRIANQNLWFVAAAAAALLMQIALGGLRWRVILRRLGANASVPDSLQFFYIAAFLNNWLWGAVAGDAVRAWLSLRMRIGVTTAISSIILDRVAAVAGVALLVLVTAPILAERLGSTASALAPAGIAAAGLIGIGIAAQLHRLPVNWNRNRLFRGLQMLSAACRTVFLRPAAAAAALGFAVAAQIALSLAAYLLGRSMDVGLALLDCVVLIQPVVLATALPISIGGWGVRETAMIVLLAVVGVPASAALALSVQLGLLSMLVALPGAVMWLRLKERAER